MKLSLVCLALCVALAAGEDCNPLRGTRDCLHTGCTNGTDSAGWYIVCHRTSGSILGGLHGQCWCTHDLNAGHKCADQNDCVGDCPHNFAGRWHCVDEACKCGRF